MNDSDYDETGLDFFDGIDTSLLNQEEPPKYFFLGADKSEEIEDEFEDEVVYSFPKERSLGDLFSADIIDEDRGRILSISDMFLMEYVLVMQALKLTGLQEL